MSLQKRLERLEAEAAAEAAERALQKRERGKRLGRVLDSLPPETVEAGLAVRGRWKEMGYPPQEAATLPADGSVWIGSERLATAAEWAAYEQLHGALVDFIEAERARGESWRD